MTGFRTVTVSFSNNSKSEESLKDLLSPHQMHYISLEQKEVNQLRNSNLAS